MIAGLVMSNKNKFNWFMVVLWAVITLMVFWLVLSRSGTQAGTIDDLSVKTQQRALKCVTCSNYKVQQGASVQHTINGKYLSTSELSL